jgi:type IV pilus assembly protein PilA
MPSPPETLYQPGSYTNYQSGASQGHLKQGLAIASLVIGIANFFTLGFLGLGILVGVIVSIVALSKIKQSPLVYGGKQLAVAGLITNIASVLTIFPFAIIMAIAIPNLLAARRAANEASAMYVLRRVGSAEEEYQNVYGKYGTLDQLESERLITPDLAAETRNGYNFTFELSTPTGTQRTGFDVVAVPVTYPNTGIRSFYVDETGVIRAANKHGGQAGKYDPPPNFDRDYSTRR